jgi:hypothetical protein
MLTDSVVLAMTNLVLALLSMAALVSREVARDRAVTSKPGRPKVIWVTNEIRSLSSHLSSGRGGPWT